MVPALSSISFIPASCVPARSERRSIQAVCMLRRVIDLVAPVNELPMPHIGRVSHDFHVVDGVRFHVAEAGEGEPLVLLHGWPQHWWSWRELIGPLAERYRVICPDIRGMGWSDAPRGGYDLRRLVD